MRLTNYFSSDNALNLSGILVTLLVGGSAVATEYDGGAWQVVAALASSQLFCFVFFLNTSNRSYQLGLFWLEATIIPALYFLVDDTFTMILSIVWIVQAAELFGPRRASFLLLANLIVFTMSLLYNDLGLNTTSMLLNVAVMGLFQVFSLSVVLRSIRERHLRVETAALNRELVATRELLSQSTAQSERVRIARDLHDILGHHMTALILNLEVANHSVRGEDTEKAQEKVEQSLALAKLLLGDIRSAVSELREDDSFDLQQSIHKLTQQIPNLEVVVDFENAPAIRTIEMAETILRCTQEAITNVLRHSAATECNISVAEIGGECVLNVSDNGKNNAEINPGNGLKGMSERITASGGELSWQQTNSGFSLLARLPLGSNP